MMKVQKSDETYVRFDRNKIIKTCMSAGADLNLSKRIAKEVAGEGYEGISTAEIRMSVYKKLKKLDVEVAERYVYRSNMRVRTSCDILDSFDNERIVSSLVQETGVNRSFANSIAKEVEKELGRMRLNYVTAPLIREIVNVKLLEHGMESVRARYTRLGMPVYDVKTLLENGHPHMPRFSPEAVHKIMSDQIAREYSMLAILPFDLADAHMSAQIYIHDLQYFALKPTTFSHDLKFFLKRGLKVDGTGDFAAVSGPAKRPVSAFMHAIKVLIAGQTEISREQYLEDFNYIMAPYVTNLPYEKVRQLAQMVAYEISQTAIGAGGQAIYANLVMDTSLPKHLRDTPAIQPGGKVIKSVKYGEYEDEAQSLFEAFCEVFSTGDFIGKPFVYPRMIVNRVSQRDSEPMELAAAVTERFGTPIYLNGGRSFYGIRRGTIQHVTLNLPQLSCIKKRDVMELLDNRMKKAFEVLLLKRKVINKNLSADLVPFLKQKAQGVRYFNPSNQLFVISYTGLEDLVRAELGLGLETKEGMRYGMKLVKLMEKMANGFANDSGLDVILTGDPKGISHTKFAINDVKRYGDLAPCRGGENPYYSKGHCVSLKKLSDKLDIEGKFNCAVSGRTSTRIRLSSKRSDPEKIPKMIADILDRKDVRYLSMSRGLSVCRKCGAPHMVESIICPNCRSRNVAIWAKDTGHLQDIRIWRPSRRQAFADALRYGTDGMGKHLNFKAKKAIMRC